jgi:ABC-type lipoprotein release transport system permease subunit
MLDNEIKEQRVLGTVLPAIFLGVAAFLLNVVVSRLVATQREQIAALKALGYRQPQHRRALPEAGGASWPSAWCWARAGQVLAR